MIRPASEEDVKKSFRAGCPFTLHRAISVVKEDKILGVCGLVWYQKRCYVFSEIAQEGFDYPKQILKIARQYLKTLPRGVYYAVADSRYTTACSFLSRLGFTKEIDLYRLEIK